MHDTGLTRFQNLDTQIIDSHAHIIKEFFAEDQKAIVNNMEMANVSKIINPGIDLKTIPELIELANTYDNVYIGIGLHPHQANEWNKFSAETIESYINHPKVVAIGECGLDFYYNNSPKEEQIFALKEQIKLARKFDKPVIIHCRDAWNELFEILSESKEHLSGVLHCFTGNTEVIKRLKQIGAHIDFYVSFSGILTFPKSQDIQEAAKIVENNKLLVETDCPFLAPLPVRGKRNEPAYVWYTAEKLAELRNQSLSEIANLCVENTIRLFNLNHKA
jgi:TatD DNase family protein